MEENSFLNEILNSKEADEFFEKYGSNIDSVEEAGKVDNWQETMENSTRISITEWKIVTPIIIISIIIGAIIRKHYKLLPQNYPYNSREPYKSKLKRNRKNYKVIRNKLRKNR